MLPHKQINQMPLVARLSIRGFLLLIVLAILWRGGLAGITPFVLGVLFAIALSRLFETMHIEVNEQGVNWHFRGNLFGGSIPIADIREAEVSYFGWQSGYGKRWTRRGMLNRAWGLDVVQIHRQKGKPVFLGASDAAAMVKAIEAMQKRWLEAN